MVEIVIIGAGPAGILAAVQLSRYGFKPIVFEKDRVGGLIRQANLIENCPGFPEGITGSEMAQLLQRQLEKAGVEVIFEEVKYVEISGELFLVETDKRSIQCKILVIATGTKPRTFLDAEIPEEVKERAFYEIHPLKGHSGTKIAIVGAGDTAFDYALSLAKRNEIFLLNRAEKPKCLPLLFKRAIKTEKIFYFKNTCIKEISAQKNKINLKLKTNNSERNLFVDFLLFAIGREPCLDFLSESILSSKNKLEEKGKLFLIGDVKNKRFRQLAIAAGDGIEAAMKINNILRG